MQTQMQRIYAEARLRKKEIAMWIVQNTATGEISPSQWLILESRFGGHAPAPQIPGSKPIGLIHVHFGRGSGSGSGLGPDNGDMYPPVGVPLFPSATFNENRFQPYYPGVGPDYDPVLPVELRKSEKLRASP